MTIPEDQEDHVQSIILNIFERALDRYDPIKGDLLRYINGVTYQQMLNIITKYHRTKMKSINEFSGGQPMVSSYGRTPPDVGAEMEILIQDINNIENDTTRSVMKLRVDGYSVKDISNQLGMRCSEVKKILSIFKIFPESKVF